MTTVTASPARRERWYNSRTMHRFMCNNLALFGVAMITVLVLACVFGPHLLPYTSLNIDLRARFAPPFTGQHYLCLLYTSPSPRDKRQSRMPSSA